MTSAWRYTTGPDCIRHWHWYPRVGPAEVVRAALGCVRVGTVALPMAVAPLPGSAPLPLPPVPYVAGPYAGELPGTVWGGLIPGYAAGGWPVAPYSQAIGPGLSAAFGGGIASAGGAVVEAALIPALGGVFVPEGISSSPIIISQLGSKFPSEEITPHSPATPDIWDVPPSPPPPIDRTPGQPEPVPEPPCALLFGGAVLVAVVVRRRRS